MFNKNNIKVSYCCMPNMDSIIRQHNTKLLSGNQLANDGCNCQKPVDCPLKGKCMSSDIVYEATVTSDNEIKKYIGSCSTTFKLRYGNHKQSFKNINKKGETELSNYIWQLKNSNTNYKIDWQIITKSNRYKKGSKKCNLCLVEKMLILKSDKLKFINCRDVTTKCMHKFKYKLINLK